MIQWYVFAPRTILNYYIFRAIAASHHVIYQTSGWRVRALIRRYLTDNGQRAYPNGIICSSVLFLYSYLIFFLFDWKSACHTLSATESSYSDCFFCLFIFKVVLIALSLVVCFFIGCRCVFRLGQKPQKLFYIFFSFFTNTRAVRSCVSAPSRCFSFINQSDKSYYELNFYMFNWITCFVDSFCKYNS